MRIKPLIVLAAILTVLVPGVSAQDGNPLGGSPSFEGRYAGDGLMLELLKNGDVYRGTITRGSDRWPLKAKAAGNALTGSFSVGAQAYF